MPGLGSPSGLQTGVVSFLMQSVTVQLTFILSRQAVQETRSSCWSQPTDKNPPPVRRETGASCYIPWKIQRQKVTYGYCPCRAIESRLHSCARSLTKAQVSFPPMGIGSRTHRTSPAAAKFTSESSSPALLTDLRMPRASG